MNFLRMDNVSYKNFLAKVDPLIRKQDTNMRQAILGIKDYFEDLKFTCAIHPKTLEIIVMETWEAIIKVLKDFIKVLKSFKQLHRTRIKVFDGDEQALTAARLKINEEFSKNRNVKDEEAIKALIKFGEDVERELRTQVIQAKEVKPGVFEAKITADTVKLDNIPYNDNAVPSDGISGGRPCCQDQIKNK